MLRLVVPKHWLQFGLGFLKRPGFLGLTRRLVGWIVSLSN